MKSEKRNPQSKPDDKGAPSLTPPADNSPKTPPPAGRAAFRAKTGGDGVREGKTPRVSVAFTGDGKIDFDSMRPATIEKLKQGIREAGAKQKLGIGKSGDASTTIKPESLGPLFWAVGTLEALATNFFAKVPQDLAFAVMPYKEHEVAEIAPDLASIIASSGPAWLIKILNEAEDGPTTRLVGKLAKIHFQKLMLLREAVKNPAVADGIREQHKKLIGERIKAVQAAAMAGSGKGGVQ